MDHLSTVVILLAITSVSLFIVSVINQRQMRTRLLNQKLNQMKRRATELEELSATLESLVENMQIPKVIAEEAIDLLGTMINIAPSNAFFEMSLEAAEQRRQELAGSERKVPLFRVMESDAAIARAQYALNEAARIIRKRQSQDHLQVAEMDQLLRDLSWANFMVKITSNTAQGHKAINRGDILRAFAYYRKALEVATEGGHKDARQNQIINELGEILNSRRRALSPSLMPETQFNPDKDSPSLEEVAEKAEQAIKDGLNLTAPSA